MERYLVYHVNRVIGRLRREMSGKLELEFEEGLSMYSVPEVFRTRYARGVLIIDEQRIVRDWVEAVRYPSRRMNMNDVIREVHVRGKDPSQVMREYNRRPKNEGFRVERER